MKYLLRILGAIIVYPISIIFVGMGTIICNILLIIWHFNFKHLFWFDNYYFYVSHDAYSFEPYEENGQWKIKEVTYDEYYKSPYDIIRNKLTREYKYTNWL